MPKGIVGAAGAGGISTGRIRLEAKDFSFSEREHRFKSDMRFHGGSTGGLLSIVWSVGVIAVALQYQVL